MGKDGEESAPQRVTRAIALGLIFFVGGIVHAHRFGITEVTLIIKHDGGVQADMNIDVDALALGISPESDDAISVAEINGRIERGGETATHELLDGVRRVLSRRVRIRFDDEKAPLSIEFPEWIEPPEEPLFPTVFGSVARFRTHLPDDAISLKFTASRAFGALRLTIRDERNGQTREELLAAGEDSAPFVFGATENRRSGWSRFLRLGFLHILPLGLDHILFVLGLFLLGGPLKPLLLQVTAFTVAHTATLALSVYGVVALPSRWVEVLIALSIVYVAVENMFVDRVRTWRLALVFGFGLLHGLGFADALRNLGLEKSRLLTSLISFNIGVELGQLAVLTLALLLLGWWRERPWYRKRIVLPGSFSIALVAIFWTIQRAIA